MTRLPWSVRYRGLNAIQGVSKAKALLPLDREMASFRAITAEEEAASALFMALKLRNYPGADKLNLGNHRHKAAVPPFLQVIAQSISKGPFTKGSFDFNWNKPSITIHFPLSSLGVQLPGSEDFRLTLEEPLHMLQSVGDERPYLFESEIAELAGAQTQANIEKVIAAQANARNTLLYASDASLPISEATEEILAKRAASVEIILLVTIAIMQTRIHQFMALQGLQAFLGVVAPNADAVFDYGPTIKADVEFKLRNDNTAEMRFSPHAKPKSD